MSTSKSKDIKWHQLHDGSRVKFNLIHFRDAIDEKVKASRKTATEIRRDIARNLNPDYSEDRINNEEKVIGNWYLRDERDYWYSRLDDIFCDYLCE